MRCNVRVNPVIRHSEEKVLSLDGIWQFRLDPGDEGVKQRWFTKSDVFTERVRVPGCWQGQGFGDKGNDKVWDFGIETRVLRRTYKGTGWYAKFFNIPEEWKGKRVWINFGGLHPAGYFYLNGKYLGSHSFPFIPVGFDITDRFFFNTQNFIVVRITEEERYLGLAYNWQGNWSGLYRGVELNATGNCWIEKLFVYYDIEKKNLKIRLKTGMSDKRMLPVILSVSVSSASGVPLAGVEKKINTDDIVEINIPVSIPSLWCPEQPSLYRIDAMLLKNRDDILDVISERTGFVKLSVKGKHMLINGQPYYFRGTGYAGWEPETGCPDTSRERWREKLKVLKEYGYNYVRCQSFIPAPEYYDVADEAGLLIQSEMGMLGAWAGTSSWHRYSWPTPEPIFYRKLKWHWEYTVMRDVNHPSANIYCMSNELLNNTDFPRIAWECYKNTKKIKPSAFVIWTDGGYNPRLPGDFVNAEADIDKKTSLPVIQHEFRWWSSYPDVRIKNKYKGAVRPYAIEFAEKAAKKNNMVSLLPVIAENSHKLQYIEARTKLENCRRDNPGLAGICHFNAMDSGFSPQGILDEFYERKLVDAETWRQTMGDTVILVNKNFNDRIITGGETFSFSFFVSDFSHPPLKAPFIKWELSDEEDKRGYGAGIIQFTHKPFRTIKAGDGKVRLPEVNHPQQLILKAKLIEGERLFKNQWTFWVFPFGIKLPQNMVIYKRAKYTWLKNSGIPLVQKNNVEIEGSDKIILTEFVDITLLEKIEKGGKVILCASEGLVRPFPPKLGLAEGRYFFLPPANYPSFEDGNSGTIILSHPILGNFPHKGFADLQFYRMIANFPPIDLLVLGCKNPVIRSISTYFISHPLGYLVLFSYGKGLLVITSLNLDPRLSEARYLLLQMVDYLSHPEGGEEIISEKAIEFLVSISSIK